MNDENESLFAWDEHAYRAGVEREVNEEVQIETPFENRIVALLNDDTTEVGRVHLGVVHVFRLEEPKVQKREAMITNLAFLTKSELLRAARQSRNVVADLRRPPGEAACLTNCCGSGPQLRIKLPPARVRPARPQRPPHATPQTWSSPSGKECRRDFRLFPEPAFHPRERDASKDRPLEIVLENQIPNLLRRVVDSRQLARIAPLLIGPWSRHTKIRFQKERWSLRQRPDRLDNFSSAATACRATDQEERNI